MNLVEPEQRLFSLLSDLGAIATTDDMAEIIAEVRRMDAEELSKSGGHTPKFKSQDYPVQETLRLWPINEQDCIADFFGDRREANAQLFMQAPGMKAKLFELHDRVFAYKTEDELVEAAHAAAIEAMRMYHQIEVTAMRAAHEATLKAMDAAQGEVVKALRDEVERLKEQHEAYRNRYPAFDIMPC